MIKASASLIKRDIPKIKNKNKFKIKTQIKEKGYQSENR
jgi:hypothetical protein